MMYRVSVHYVRVIRPENRRQVSPRRYSSETRQASSQATRRRIVLGALDLVKAEGGLRDFTIRDPDGFGIRFASVLQGPPDA